MGASDSKNNDCTSGRRGGGGQSDQMDQYDWLPYTKISLHLCFVRNTVENRYMLIEKLPLVINPSASHILRAKSMLQLCNYFLNDRLQSMIDTWCTIKTPKGLPEDPVTKKLDRFYKEERLICKETIEDCLQYMEAIVKDGIDNNNWLTANDYTVFEEILSFHNQLLHKIKVEIFGAKNEGWWWNGTQYVSKTIRHGKTFDHRYDCETVIVRQNLLKLKYKTCTSNPQIPNKHIYQRERRGNKTISRKQQRKI
jgi:hypothetical protein